MACSSSSGPLSEFRICDLTTFLSGPYCTQILSDLGADVIKVEPPDGDPTRHIPPHFVGKDSAYYLSVNRNKKSVVLDLKTAAGRAVARKLALASDVVVENFRPGVIPNLGLSYEELSETKPDLVWCSISGFGQDGPYRDLPAYDMIVQALSGAMSITGEPDGAPVRAGVPMGDLAAGMYAAIGILAALHERKRSGRGQKIDVSMLDCQVAMLSYQAAYYLHSGVVPGRQGAAHDSIPTYRSFVAKDGVTVVITANTERMWQGLCKVLGLENLIADPRFATNEQRLKHRQELWPLLEAAFRQRSADDWVAALRASAVPVAVVKTLDRVMEDEQVLHRKMIIGWHRPDNPEVRVVGNPVKHSRGMREEHDYPPALGEDTREVLQNVLHMSEKEIAEVVGSPPAAKSKTP